MKADYPLLLLPHEVMYHLITKRGMGVKRATCVEARVDQRSGTLNDRFAISSIATLTLACELVFMVVVPPSTTTLKSASVEVCSRNLLTD